MAKRIEVLWSGGWDSTFMLCKLAWENDAKIQPYYLDIDRPGQKEEHRAMQRIMAVLKKKKDLKGKLLPVKLVPQKFFIPSDDVEEAWHKYKGNPYKIGGQQRFLAEFSKTHKGICWGQERYLETPGHMTRLLMDKGGLRFTESGVGYFEKEAADPDVYTLFGNLTCPVAKYSELMMWDVIRQRGYEDVFQHVHFCYFPIDGKPCGMCLPCEVKMKQKLNFLFPDEALKRNRIYNALFRDEFVLLKTQELLDISTCFKLYVDPLFKEDFLKQYIDPQTILSRFIGNKVDSAILFYKDYFDELLGST